MGPPGLVQAGCVPELLLRHARPAPLGPQHRPEPPEAVLGSGGTVLVRPDQHRYCSRRLQPQEVPVLASSELVSIVGVADLNRARDFYGGVLGLPVADESPFAMVVDSNGSMLRLTAVEKPVPAPYSVVAWKVSDIAATVDELAQRGVTFVRYDSLVQDDRGVWTEPDGTKVAWFPEGNNLSVVQFA